MQPIYCTWEANGAKAHTPGLFRRGRVTSAKGWVNAAVGELATLWARSDGEAAHDQKWASLEIWPSPGTKIIPLGDGVIRIVRRLD